MNVDPAVFANFVPMDAMAPCSRISLARSAKMLCAKAGDLLFEVGEAYARAFFLVAGEIQLENSEGDVLSTLRASHPDARHRIGHPRPGHFAARCVGPAQILTLDTRLLDITAAWDQSEYLEVAELGVRPQSHLLPDDDWMVRLLQMPLLQHLPPENLQMMFHRMSEISPAASDVVVRQGDPGDYFYVVVEGRCRIVREVPERAPLVLAEMAEGSCFGEEALIGDEPRNATVQMITPGKLMRLAKEDFRSLLKAPLQRRLALEDAEHRVCAGTAKWLDVRLPAEYSSGHRPDSINLPLHLLRLKLRQLDPALSYIAVCDTGRRSSVAAFLLGQEGLDAYLLDQNFPAVD